MMLPGGEPLDREGFEELLDLARDGIIRSDMGTTEEMDAALYAVATAPDDPPPQALIDAARAAFAER